jgi:ketol-acid reductoisomerase
MPVFKELYARVASGEETRRVISSCGRKNYKQQLGKELSEMGNSEMWQAGKTTRSLRPNKSQNVPQAAGTGGRQSN